MKIKWLSGAGPRRWPPHSLGGLVLVSFTLVVLPLLLVVLGAAYAVNRIAGQSEEIVNEGVQLTQGSLLLMEELVTMERSARQYLVVGDPGLLQVFRSSHQQFDHTVHGLMSLSMGERLGTQIAQLSAGERELANRFLQSTQAKPAAPNRIDGFDRLSREAHQLWIDSSRVVGHRVDALRTRAGWLQQVLVWGALLLVPLTFALAYGLSRLILRPVRQIDHAIHHLGDGRFDQPVAVSGPRDLEYLGERLDWTRRRLQELETGKQRFLRDMSHDLKTPLTTLLEGVSLLDEQVLGMLNAEQASLMRILAASGRQLQERIEQLLQYSRLQGQFASLNLKLLDFAQLIEQSLKALMPAIAGRGLQVDKHMTRAALWGDEAKLRQVVDNLLSNAIKYAPRGSTLHIVVSLAEGWVAMRLVDEGPGISGEDRAHLFEPFYRGRPPQEGIVRGSGLGLAIVQEYVQAHRGRVRLDVPREGEGAVFVVELPPDLREENAE
ncbi:HAMP domain-containing sensor histidine kinase [Acidihalobacter prosperus]|uniref:histidine kinase n=1 Tax=Acidihalobacter prosperus TaxID=160660 RepID=A0A1A6C375_9GAMM|nr:HAMP domain-containing sensor histidine kinase [Acidihalobacter prosperus]OBS09013.1 two-component sensor histidine kinase [Acidihalobacter prosperus]